MNLHEFTSFLGEAADKSSVEAALRDAGYSDFKYNGSKMNVLVQIPDGERKNEFRSAVLQEILSILKKKFKSSNPEFSDDSSLSSLGGIIFADSDLKILIKDAGKQGDQSAGVANEIEMAGIIQSVIDKFGSADITFKDPRGKKLSIKNANTVHVAGRDTAERKKADVVISSPKGMLPISIKKVNADMWESADSLFGKRARAILDDLVANGDVELNQIKSRKTKDGSIPVYALSKEIVMEPTEEEALNAVFGSDLSPKGGIVIQTFKPEHFVQDENKITVDCHAVIANTEDIPESHLMVWILRNDSDRNSASLGIAGIRPLGVTLTRGIGKSGTKDVILVDVNGNVVENPNKKKDPVDADRNKKIDLSKDEPEKGSEKATRSKR
jgi:hypothetical protein